MKTYEVGHFKVVIEISGTGPFTAVGDVQPYRSMETLRRVVAEGKTKQEAEEAALEKARTASAELFLEGKNRRHID